MFLFSFLIAASLAILELSSSETYVEFDGVSEYGYTNVAVTSDVTIEAYIKIIDGVSNPTYFCLNKPSSGCNNNYMVYSVQRSDSTGMITGMAAQTPGASHVGATLSVSVQSSDDFVHVAWQNSGGGFSTTSWTFYLNGVKLGSPSRVVVPILLRRQAQVFILPDRGSILAQTDTIK